eukprot:Lankesteria_metandrocarpae@DN5324_c0_g1_i3.p1
MSDRPLQKFANNFSDNNNRFSDNTMSDRSLQKFADNRLNNAEDSNAHMSREDIERVVAQSVQEAWHNAKDKDHGMVVNKMKEEIDSKLKAAHSTMALGNQRMLKEDKTCVERREILGEWAIENGASYLLHGPVTEDVMTRFVYDMSRDEQYWKFSDGTLVPKSHRVLAVRIRANPIFQDGWMEYRDANPGVSCSHDEQWSGEDFVISLRDENIYLVFIVDPEYIAAWNNWFQTEWQATKELHKCGTGCNFAVTASTGEDVDDLHHGLSLISEGDNPFESCKPCISKEQPSHSNNTLTDTIATSEHSAAAPKSQYSMNVAAVLVLGAMKNMI